MQARSVQGCFWLTAGFDWLEVETREDSFMVVVVICNRCTAGCFSDNSHTVTSG